MFRSFIILSSATRFSENPANKARCSSRTLVLNYSSCLGGLSERQQPSQVKERLIKQTISGRAHSWEVNIPNSTTRHCLVTQTNAFLNVLKNEFTDKQKQFSGYAKTKQTLAAAPFAELPACTSALLHNRFSFLFLFSAEHWQHQ